MAPISESLGKSLDLLRDRIREAEAALSKMPFAEGKSVPVSESDEGFFILLFEMSSKNEPRLWRSFTPKSDGFEYDGDTVPVPLKDLPVAERIEYAACIPKLIEAAAADEKEGPTWIARIAAEIEQSIAENC